MGEREKICNHRMKIAIIVLVVSAINMFKSLFRPEHRFWSVHITVVTRDNNRIYSRDQTECSGQYARSKINVFIIQLPKIFQILLILYEKMYEENSIVIWYILTTYHYVQRIFSLFVFFWHDKICSKQAFFSFRVKFFFVMRFFSSNRFFSVLNRFKTVLIPQCPKCQLLTFG